MSFVKTYANYCSEFTDSPEVFHRRIALSILSTVMGRKVFIWQGHKRIFPNLWMIVVAPSSFYRKSYSLGIAEDILRSLSPLTDEKYILPREFSHEKFVEIMAEQPQGLLISYEFRTFMAMLSREYMAGTQSMIMELFDCPAVYDRKIKAGSFEIRDPFLNILSATNMDCLKTSIKDIDLGGGFLPRFLIVSYSGKKENSIAWQIPHDIQKKDALIQKLLLYSKLSGPCVVTKPALSHYEEWYRKFEEKWSKPSALSPFYARLQEYAKKLAILTAIDETGTIVVEKDHMVTACNIANEYAEEIKNLVEEDLTYMDRSQRKVIDALKQAGGDGISRETLIRKTRLLADRQLNPILSTLMESRQTYLKTEKFINSKGVERTKIIYFWVNGTFPEND